MAEPVVSVVVSTRDRPERLARLLASMQRQTVDRESFEVVVVDDGSGPATAALLGQESERAALRLTTLRNERSLGPGAGRNRGWRAAQAPLVAFIDDDCTADPGWLAAGLEASRAQPGTIVQGRTLPEPSEQDHEGLFSHTVRIERLGPQYETCNIFYPRDVLESLGGFDERFGTRPGGEDTDLAWRAIETGHACCFAPDAVVFHAVLALGVAGKLRMAARWGPTVRVFADHPETRVMLYRGTFWNVWHYLLWRSLLSLAGPRWLARMIITLHFRELRRRALQAGAGEWAVAFLLVHDVVECLAVTRGAVSYRTLVL